MNKKKIIAWSLFVFWLLLIFFFSSQNGNSSSELSNGVLTTIENIFHIPLTNEFFSLFIRKTAHFSEYFILGILSCNLVRQYRVIKKKEYIFIILFCVLYAFSDEFHQMFVSGRTPQIFDVCIDTVGSILGIGIYYLFKKIRENQKL